MKYTDHSVFIFKVRWSEGEVPQTRHKFIRGRRVIAPLILTLDAR